MYLTIDAGNTRTKAALFDKDGRLAASAVFPEDAIRAVQEWLQANHAAHAIVATTGKRTWALHDLGIPGLNIELSHETPLPVKIVYSTPHTLGRDRIAAACGAAALFPGKNCLVVDAGTCVTTDLVHRKGIFLGGNIAPGLAMRLKSMHEYTARLPLAEAGWPETAFGDSTVHALQNGAALGIVMEIEGLFYRAKDAFGEVIIVMTGGDAPFLAGRMECQIFAEPELVAYGLFQILDFNVKNL